MENKKISSAVIKRLPRDIMEKQFVPVYVVIAIEVKLPFVQSTVPVFG